MSNKAARYTIINYFHEKIGEKFNYSKLNSKFILTECDVNHRQYIRYELGLYSQKMRERKRPVNFKRISQANMVYALCSFLHEIF